MKSKDIYNSIDNVHIAIILFSLVFAIYFKSFFLEYSFNLLLFVYLTFNYFKKAKSFNKNIFISCLLLIIGNSLVFTTNLKVFFIGSILISSSYLIRISLIIKHYSKRLSTETVSYFLIFLLIFIIFFIYGFSPSDPILKKICNIYYGLMLVLCGTLVLITFLKDMSYLNLVLFLGMLFIVLANLGISSIGENTYRLFTVFLDQFFFCYGHYLFLKYFTLQIPKKKNKPVFYKPLT